jgi:hypothetical protein
MVFDETIIGSAPTVSWAPVRGKHLLSFMTNDGSPLERIGFEGE